MNKLTYEELCIHRDSGNWTTQDDALIDVLTPMERRLFETGGIALYIHCGRNRLPIPDCPEGSLHAEWAAQAMVLVGGASAERVVPDTLVDKLVQCCVTSGWCKRDDAIIEALSEDDQQCLRECLDAYYFDVLNDELIIKEPVADSINGRCYAAAKARLDAYIDEAAPCNAGV